MSEILFEYRKPAKNPLSPEGQNHERDLLTDQRNQLLSLCEKIQHSNPNIPNPSYPKESGWSNPQQSIAYVASDHPEKTYGDRHYNEENRMNVISSTKNLGDGVQAMVAEATYRNSFHQPEHLAAIEIQKNTSLNPNVTVGVGLDAGLVNKQMHYKGEHTILPFAMGTAEMNVKTGKNSNLRIYGGYTPSISINEKDTPAIKKAGVEWSIDF